MGTQSSGLRLVWSAAAALVAAALVVVAAPQARALPDPPTVEITAKPSNSTYNVFPRFKFESSEPSSFRCAIDPIDPNNLGSCRPYELPQLPLQLTGTHRQHAGYSGIPLLFGTHRFCVRATNGAGISSEPSCYTWEVTPPRPKEFNPELTVSASTYRAGANPDLTVEMRKSFENFNHCTVPDAPDSLNMCEELYLEQNLKKMVSHLPPGLLSDANAAPYCDPYNEGSVLDPYDRDQYYPQWRCSNEESRVGKVAIAAQACDLSDLAQVNPTIGCLDGSLGDESGWDFEPPPGAGKVAATKYGAVYNARPRTEGPYAGEQGHLVVLWPSPGSFYASDVKTDLSVTVRESDVGIDSAVDDMVDLSFVRVLEQYVYPAQIVQMKFTLEGATGLDEGHPLLTNPTFCDPQTVDVEFQGYLQNSWRQWNPMLPSPLAKVPGQGEGKTVPDSAPYKATNCDTLPYSPAFAASTDTDSPGSPVALSTVITQKDDEATTKRVDVEFPQGMGINLKSSLKPCAADKPDRNSCPDSVMGSVEAFSRLLPTGETLKGDVFLTGLKGNKLSLSVLLSGFIDLRLDATAGVDPSSGRLTASFDDLPSVQLSKFTLNLAGADKSLITNPRRCGDNTTKATFTSHSGKVHTVESTSQIKGCSNPEFDVELTELAKGKRTGIELEVSSGQKPIKEVKFGLDRHMKLSSKGLGKKRKFGEVSVTTASGSEEAALKRSAGAKQKEKKAFSLKVSALKGLGVNIYRKAYISKKKGASKKKGSKKTRKVIKSRVSVKPLPKNDTSKVSVSLNPDETKLLRNPRNKCAANFIALVKTTDGVKHTLKKKLKLRGKGCGKKKVKRK